MPRQFLSAKEIINALQKGYSVGVALTYEVDGDGRTAPIILSLDRRELLNRLTARFPDPRSRHLTDFDAAYHGYRTIIFRRFDS